MLFNCEERAFPTNELNKSVSAVRPHHRECTRGTAECQIWFPNFFPFFFSFLKIAIVWPGFLTPSLFIPFCYSPSIHQGFNWQLIVSVYGSFRCHKWNIAIKKYLITWLWTLAVVKISLAVDIRCRNVCVNILSILPQMIKSNNHDLISCDYSSSMFTKPFLFFVF